MPPLSSFDLPPHFAVRALTTCSDPPRCHPERGRGAPTRVRAEGPLRGPHRTVRTDRLKSTFSLNANSQELKASPGHSSPHLVTPVTASWYIRSHNSPR